MNNQHFFTMPVSTHRCFRFLQCAAWILSAFWVHGMADAQGLRLQFSPALPGDTSVPQSRADYIVAVVNSEPVTNNDVRRETQHVLLQLAQQRKPLPDARSLTAEILDGLINDKIQIQMAREIGLRIDESAIDQAEQAVAAQNHTSVAELRSQVERSGLSSRQFRSQLHDRLLLQRLREREVEPKVHVSDQDIDQYVHDQESNPDRSKIYINLAQILIAVPETASDVQIEALKVRALRAHKRARAGEDFAALVREFSDAKDTSNGGQMGQRTADRYPALLVDAAFHLFVGEVADLVRSPAGFHILKMVEKINPAMPTMAVTQSHVRHILIQPSAKLSKAAIVAKLTDLKKRVVSGQADFAALARDYSHDASADQGGDLGWVNPGSLVPEFEDVMNQLPPGELSDPLVSRFGVHLIQLLERRRAILSKEDQREAVRHLLREKKLDEAYRVWVTDLRGRAYIEMREAPQ